MQYSPTQLEVYFLSLVNETRAKAGVKPLTFDGELLKSADAHSAWMGKTDTYSHTGVNGSSAGDRMKSAGYGWQSWGENIAYSYGPLTEATVWDLHHQFLNSPVHYKNIVSGSFTEIGIGLQVGKYKGETIIYVTQNFGRPDSVEAAEAKDVGKPTGVLRMGGTDSSDRMKGTSGNDHMYGGEGNDTYYVNEKGDKAFELEGQGTDRVISTISYSLSGQHVENLTLSDKAKINGTGNDLDNVLTGNSAANTLKGIDGNDRLNGKGGKDVLWGGTGIDVFVFSTAKEADGDTIRDFVSGTDVIDLRGIDANTRAKGNQAFEFIGSQSFHKHAGELRAYKSGGNMYIAGDTNGDGKADFKIKVSGYHTFADVDFLL